MRFREDLDCLGCGGTILADADARWSREVSGPVHPECHEDNAE